MFLIIFVVLLLTAYTSVGAFYARGRYANILAAANQDQSDFGKIGTAKARIKELDAHYKQMRSTNSTVLREYHTSSCDKYHYSHIGVCNCGAVKKNRAERDQKSNFVEGKIEQPDIAKPIIFWPAYLLGDFVKGGEPSDKELARQIKELREAEHDAAIAKLRAEEAAALDRELALVKGR